MTISYISPVYYILVAATVALYYIFPLKFRWITLLAASLTFYYLAISDRLQLLLFVLSIVLSYTFGLLIKKAKDNGLPLFKQKLLLFVGISFSSGLLLISKSLDFLLGTILNKSTLGWILPLGLSFYSLQVISYLVDIYRGKISPQNNFLKYCLFISFFPQIIQGPIPRYSDLGHQLFTGNSFSSKNFMGGIQLIIWGFFLKLMIADKAAVVVNTILNNTEAYRGVFLWIGFILYSIQLYTDFYSCTTLSRGVSQMFGIKLSNNFNHPFFSSSIKELWRRWHMSLSYWLRDYVYIPLGGSKKGYIRKSINLLITFAISGIWHGYGITFLLWGCLQALFQIIGDLIPKKITAETSSGKRIIKIFITCFLFLISLVFFRAESLDSATVMIKSMFSDMNIWILFDDSIFRLGLVQKEWEVLFVSVAVLFLISLLQEKKISIREWFNKQILIIRWAIYLCMIWSIWIFGTYGFGFNAQDFMYGGF